jgi:hypothetical protein
MSKNTQVNRSKGAGRWLLAAAAVAGLSVVAVGQNARATVISYGAVNPGGSGLDAYAVFNVSSSGIAVTFNNYSPTTASDVQEIYGVDFTVLDAAGNPASIGSPTISAVSGTEVTLVEDTTKGSATYGDYLINTPSAPNKTITSNTELSKSWLISNPSTGVVDLTIHTSQPSDMIIAAPPSPDNYGNSSGLNSTTNFNPQLYTGATFTVDISGGLATTDTIGDVTLLYGTGPTSATTVPFNNGTPTPEPSVLAFLGMGAIGSLMLMRKRR